MPYNVEAHRNVVSMSELGNILGFGRISRMQYLRTKLLGLKPKELNQFEKQAVEFGTKMEGPAIDWICKHFKANCTHMAMLNHRDEPRIAGTIDGMLDLDTKTVLEIKWRYYPGPAKARPFQTPPAQYYTQVQGYMEIYDCEKAVLASFSLLRGINLFFINRDRSFWQFCRKRIDEFLNFWDICKTQPTGYAEELVSKWRMKGTERSENIGSAERSMGKSIYNVDAVNQPF